MYYVCGVKCGCHRCNENFNILQAGSEIPTFDPETTSTIDIKRAVGFTETNSLLYMDGKPIMYEYESMSLLRE